MRPLNVLLVLVSLLIIGGAAWLVLGKDAPKPVAATAAVPAGPSTLASRNDAELQTPTQRPGTTGQAQPERVAQAEPEHEAESVLGSPNTPAIRGRVVDALGNPLAGATVYAAGGPGFSVPLDTTGLEEMRWFKRSTTETDAQGAFELTGPKPGLLRLAVRAPGFAPFDKDQIPLPAEPEHALEDIVMEEGVVLSGRVVDSLGRSVAGASLWKVSDSGPGFFFRVGGSRSGVLLAETGAAGEFRIDQLASGPWKFRTTTEDHPDAIAEGVSERPGQVQSGLVIGLEDGYEIRGRLTGAPAGMASELNVRATPARGDDGGWGMLIDAELGGGESRQASVAADGSFAVRGLKKDQRYKLQARRSGTDFFSSTQSEAVTATAGDGGIEIVWQPEAVLVFQVVDALTQEPLTRFDVSAGTRWAMPLMDPDNRPVREHEDGMVRFGNLRPKSDKDRAKLEIRAVGYADHEQEDILLRVGQETDLGVIALQRVPVVNVTVRDRKTGAAIEGARVILKEEQKRRRGGNFVMQRTIEIEDEHGGDVMIHGDGHHGRSDENGLAKVNAFDGKFQRLTVSHPRFADFKGEPFEVPAGESVTREVLLGPGGAVQVTLLAPDGSALAGGRVDHRPPGEGSHNFGGGGDNVTDGNGRVLFEHLEPGTHRFRAGGSGGGWSGMMGGNLIVAGGASDHDDEGWVEVVVVEDATCEVTVTAPLELQLTGRVREGGKNLAGATVRLAPRGEDDGPMSRMHMLGGGGPSGKTDGQGRYVLENVKAGEYTLTVEHASRLMPTDFQVDMYDTDRVFDVDLSVAIIEGRVTDQAGEPLAGLKVWAELAQAESAPGQRMVGIFVQADSGGNSVMFGGDSGGKVENKTDADGRYSLRGVQTDVELQVVAEGRGVQKGRSETVEVAPDEILRGIDLTLEAAGEIQVVAQNADGSPANNLIVTARFEGESGAEDEPEPKTGFIAAEGKTRLRGLAPGAWRVTLRGMGFGGNTPEGIPDQVVEVTVGETATATFTIP